MDADSHSSVPLLRTRDTITIFASRPWKMSTVPSSIYFKVNRASLIKKWYSYVLGNNDIVSGSLVFQLLTRKLFLVSLVHSNRNANFPQGLSNFLQLPEVCAKDGDVSWRIVVSLTQEVADEILDHSHLHHDEHHGCGIPANVRTSYMLNFETDSSGEASGCLWSRKKTSLLMPRTAGYSWTRE